MSDLKFNCPHCQQRLGVPEAVMGLTIPCPLCQGRIRLPERPRTEPESAPPTTGLRAIGTIVTLRKGDIKFSCPLCDVHIVIAGRAAGKQITCQRCGQRITVPGALPTPPAVQPPPPPPPQPSPVPDKVDARLIPELIDKLRSGDSQAGRALLQVGESVVPALVDGFKEHALDEPDTNRGADYIVNLLVKCGALSVPPLIAKLGKSRHAYLALGRIGNEDAVTALTCELSSVNWRRVEVACIALGLVETPHALKIVDKIEKVLNTTRSGEVYSAAAATIAAIRKRYPKTIEPKALTLQEKVAQSKVAPLKAMVTR